MVTVPDPDIWYHDDAGFPHPDWGEFAKWIEGNVPDGSREEAWNTAIAQWLARLKNRLGEATFHTDQSNHFLLLSELNASRTKLTLDFLEKGRAFLSRQLGKYAADTGFARRACIVISNIDDYYAYISHYYSQDGEYSTSGGVFLEEGCPPHHVVLGDDVGHLQPTLALQLAGSSLSHLAIPLWLGRAFKHELAKMLVPISGPLLTREIVEHHESQWNAATIQDFWRGTWSWENSLGDDLAVILLNIIQQDLRPEPERLLRFVCEARPDDAGESSAQENLGVSLGEVAEVFLGPGDWTPKRPEAGAGN